MSVASVVVSTYNRLETLILVLEGYKRQSVTDFEVIVADDGSTQDTRTFLEERKDTYPFRLKHVWQKDNGFRKARSLNLGIAEADSEYIIFSDGDCIPHKEFVNAHIVFKKKGCFLVGRTVLLSEKISNSINTSCIAEGKLEGFNLDIAFDYIFGETRFWEYSVYIKSEMLLNIIQKLKKSKVPFGGNFSVWKDDLVRVNGFNEEFTDWGNEDGELGYRLNNAGLEPKLALGRAINYHCYHDRSHVKRNAGNVEMATYARTSGLTRCTKGLDRHLSHSDADGQKGAYAFGVALTGSKKCLMRQL